MKISHLSSAQTFVSTQTLGSAFFEKIRKTEIRGKKRFFFLNCVFFEGFCFLNRKRVNLYMHGL